MERKEKINWIYLDSKQTSSKYIIFYSLSGVLPNPRRACASSLLGAGFSKALICSMTFETGLTNDLRRSGEASPDFVGAGLL